MSEEENRHASNLLLLCLLHAWEIDDVPDRYPAEMLRDWKHAQLAEYERARRSWRITETEAQEAVSPLELKGPVGWVLPPLGPVVKRPKLSEALIDLLQTQPSTLAAVVGAHGTGGFGKTTLAKYVCHDPRLPAAFPGGLLWVTLGEHVRGADLAERINELVELLTGRKSDFSAPEQAGRRLGALLDQCPGPVLLVIDDVWTDQQLERFQHGGARCVRLVTTRNRWLVPPAAAVTVDQMTSSQAATMLQRDVPDLPAGLLAELLTATGRWPVLLNLVNRALYRTVTRGSSPTQAAAKILERLRRAGPAAVDLDNPENRSQAVAATVRSGLDLLPAEAEDRFAELATFSTYREIPVAGLELLWAATGGLDTDGVRQMVEALDDLSLLDYRPDPGTIRLHDVLRDYVTHQSSAERTAAYHQALLDTAARMLTDGEADAGHAWWTLPRQYDPVFAQLAHHLTAAGQDDERRSLVTDLRWVEAAIHRHGLALVERDGAEMVTQAVRQSAHLLTAAAAGPSLGAVLASRLSGVPELRPLIARYEEQLGLPRLANKWPLPDQPHPALARTIAAREPLWRGILAAIPGARLATRHSDGVVCVWDIQTGHRQHALDVGMDSTDFLDVAAGSGGAWLAIGDTLLTQVWDLTTGKLMHVIDHPSGLVELAAAADHDFLVTLEENRIVRILDTTTGDCRHERTYGGTTAILICVATDGSWLAVKHDHEIHFWDPNTGQQRSTAPLDGPWISDLASAGGGTWLATSGRERDVELWDPDTGACVAVLPSSGGMVVPAEGDWVATTDEREFHIWDLPTKTRVATVAYPDGRFSQGIAAHNGAWLATQGAGRIHVLSPRDGRLLLTEQVMTDMDESGAVSCDDGRLATVDSFDPVVRLWEPTAGMRTSGAYPEWNIGPDIVEVSPDGSWLVADSSADDALAVCHVESGRLLQMLAGHNGYVADVHISRSGRWLATAGSDHTVRIWDPVTGHCSHVLNRSVAARHHEQGFIEHGMVGDPTDRWIAVADHHVVRMWNCDTGALLRTLEGHTKPIRSVSIAPDGTWLASAGEDGTVRIWESDTGECTRVIETDGPIRYATILSDNNVLIVSHTELSVYRPETDDLVQIHSGAPIHHVQLAPDDSWVATIDEDQAQVHIWNPRTGAHLAVLSEHTKAIHMTDVQEDGSALVTVARDNTVRIWNSHTWQCTQVLRYGEFLHHTAISADGRWVTTAASEKRVSVWNTSTGAIQAEMWLDSPVNGLLWLPGSHDLCVLGFDGLYLYTLVTE